MAITAWGFDGPIQEGPWALMSSLHGAVYNIADGTEQLRVSVVANADRTVNIAPGAAFCYGVLSSSDSAVQVQVPTVTSGTSRWDLIVMRYDWTTNTASLTYVLGGADDNAAFNVRNKTKGDVVDQPLAMIQVTTGSQTPTAIIDLRAWAANAGMIASHDYVRRYLNQLGSEVRIGDVVWTYGLDASGVAGWVSNDLRPRRRGWLNVRTTQDSWAGGQNGVMAALSIAASDAIPGTYLIHGTCDVNISGTIERAFLTRYTVNGALVPNREFPSNAPGGVWRQHTPPTIPYYHPGGAMQVVLGARCDTTATVRRAEVVASYLGPAQG